MELGVFALSAFVSLAASVLLVSRLERVGERLGVSEALLGLIAALAADEARLATTDWPVLLRFGLAVPSVS
jgi:hypothetical protein